RRGPADASVVASGGSINIAQVDIKADLKVTLIPRISSENRVNLTLKVDAERFVDPNIESSNLSKLNRNAETNANVSSGDILVIGGLTTETVDTAEYRWPILSSIPIIGNLFRSTLQTNLQESLVIFV